MTSGDYYEPPTEIDYLYNIENLLRQILEALKELSKQKDLTKEGAE